MHMLGQGVAACSPQKVRSGERRSLDGGWLSSMLRCDRAWKTDPSPDVWDVAPAQPPRTGAAVLVMCWCEKTSGHRLLRRTTRKGGGGRARGHRPAGRHFRTCPSGVGHWVTFCQTPRSAATSSRWAGKQEHNLATRQMLSTPQTDLPQRALRPRSWVSRRAGCRAHSVPRGSLRRGPVRQGATLREPSRATQRARRVSSGSRRGRGVERCGQHQRFHPAGTRPRSRALSLARALVLVAGPRVGRLWRGRRALSVGG